MQPDGCQARARASLILFCGTTGHADTAYQYLAFTDRQTAPEYHQTWPQWHPDTQGFVASENLSPLGGRKAKTGSCVGLVNGNVDRVQKGTRHAQKGHQYARRVGDGNVDFDTQLIGMFNSRPGHRQSSLPAH